MKAETIWQLALQGLQVAIVAAAFFVAWRAFYQTRNSGQSAARTFLRTSLKDVVLRELTERPFEERPGSSIPGTTPPIKYLRAAKSVARRHVQTDYAAWREASSVEKNTWQNHVSFETSEGLQQFGIAAFTGAIPLHAALANVADVIIDDWLICAAWIKSYQIRERVSKTVSNDPGGEVFYHRRHAEWIFLVALAWMRKEGWTYPDIYKNSNAVPTSEQLAQRLKNLTSADAGLLPDDVRREVRRLTNIAI